MIKVHCHTNLDIMEQWPDKLPDTPQIGQKIESLVIRNGFKLTLEIVNIT